MTSTRDGIPVEIVNRVVPEGRRLGLVIGIDAYEDTARIRPLRAAVRDAEAMHAVMVDPACGRFEEKHTVVLTDKEATGDRIRTELSRLRRNAGKNDEVWFFFAGHASIVDDEHRLLPVNADLDTMDVSTVDFAGLFNRIDCRRKIVFLDCCHSGATDASTRHVHDIESVFRSYDASGTITFCSSEGDEKSVELKKENRGAFSYWLERGLRGEADADGSGVVTSEELWRYVCENVEMSARKENVKQRPRRKEDTSGVFALTVNIAAINRRLEEEARQSAQRQAVADQLKSDRQALLELLGDSDEDNLSTEEMKDAIRALQENGPATKGIRRALDRYAKERRVDDASVSIRGALVSARAPSRGSASAAVPPPPANASSESPPSFAPPTVGTTAEVERRVRERLEEVAKRGAEVSASHAAASATPKRVDAAPAKVEQAKAEAAKEARPKAESPNAAKPMAEAPEKAPPKPAPSPTAAPAPSGGFATRVYAWITIVVTLVIVGKFVSGAGDSAGVSDTTSTGDSTSTGDRTSTGDTAALVSGPVPGTPQYEQPYFDFQVEKPVVMAPGATGPSYPDTLRSAGIQGTVLAQFVVDTFGRAEMATFKVLRTDNDLFTTAVKSALARTKFLPAEVGGRKVKQLVQQPFQFSLNR